MFAQLEEINRRPEPFERYTAADLWTDEHTSGQMLAYHLNDDVDVSSRRGAFIERSVAWIVSHFGVGPRASAEPTRAPDGSLSSQVPIGR